MDQVESKYAMSACSQKFPHFQLKVAITHTLDWLKIKNWSTFTEIHEHYVKLTE